MKKILDAKVPLSRRHLCLAGAALLLAASMTVGSAMAYFTTYATATGGVSVDLGFTETIPNEEVKEWAKHIVVDNTGDYDCYVRVRAFAGDRYKDGLEISGEGWSKGAGDDEFYYYKDIVPAGGSTPDELLVHIDNMQSQEDFNVIIVQESTPVLYDGNGEPYADWNVVLDSVQDEFQ